jgi:hypothetical protein
MIKRLFALTLFFGLLPLTHATIIYEIHGFLDRVSFPQASDEALNVLKVGDLFTATAIYEPSLEASGGCKNDGPWMQWRIDFSNVSFHSNRVSGCSRIGGFYSGVTASGDLDGFGSIDSWLTGLGDGSAFPTDFSDQAWLNAHWGALLLLPGNHGYSNYNYASYGGAFTSVVSRSVPEPATLALFALSLFGAATLGRRMLRHEPTAER